MKHWLSSLFPKSRHVLFQTAQFVPLTPGLSAGPPKLMTAIQAADLAGFLTATFNIAISVGAILAVLRIGYAGFKYMTTDAVGKKTDAIKMIQDAVIGLLLLLAIFLILERINPNLLKLNFIGGGTGTGAAPAATSPFPGN